VKGVLWTDGATHTDEFAAQIGYPGECFMDS